MNRRIVLSLVCLILRIEAIAMIPAFFIALAQGETAALKSFAFSIIILVAASMLTYTARPKRLDFQAKEGFLVVAIGWILVVIFGALPFVFSGAIPRFIDCLFESMSGFTTTGATILQEIESLPMSILYWRSFTHWLGGMGVLILLISVMPMSKKSGHSLHLLRAESTGPEVNKIMPRMKDSAKMLYGVYVGLTIAQIAFLLAGGLPLFDSVTTAFSTAGTGGFSIWNDSMVSYSYYIQNVVTVFMLLFGVSFNIYFLLRIRHFKAIKKNLELWVYLIIFGISTVAITANILPLFNGVQDSLHHASFQVASIMTTTGVATADFNVWPQFSRTLLFLLMFIGACAGSTAGGMKISRIILWIKLLISDLRRMVRPRSVQVIHMNGHIIGKDTINVTYSYLVAYVLIGLGAFILISLNGLDLETSASAVVTCISNVGPGLGVVGPMGNYSIFSDFSKIVLSITMLVGRLEFFPAFMLISPAAWK